MNPDVNISLRPFHFFASDEKTKFFTRIQNTLQLTQTIEWCKEQQTSLLILGAGSNVLFVKDYEGMVAIMEIMGIKKINESATEVVLEVGAGENWSHFVSYCVQKGWGGIENLSLIPGTVGASPIQNIGAYGAEVKDCITLIKAFDIVAQTWITLENKECAFGYRTSIFKQNPNRYIIAAVQFTLQKQPKLNIDYGVIRSVLHEKGIKNPSISDLAAAIIQIRREKLPDPKILGNAGSFFKNPIISKEKFNQLEQSYPNIIAHPISDNEYKIAAGWLIESSGWKGKRIGNVACFEKQALVIVSYGIESGKEVFEFSEKIIQSVATNFNIKLEREVNVY